MFKKIANIFKHIFKNRTKDSMYKIDDRLFFYYVDENGKNSFVRFTVKTVYVNIIQKEGYKDDYEFKYEGSNLGSNYFGIAPENLVGKTMEELIAKLVSQNFKVIEVR